MLYGEKSRKELNDYIEKTITETLSHRKTRIEFYDVLLNKFGLPTDIPESLVAHRKDISEFTNYEMFCFLYALDKNRLKKYFTKKEIDLLSNEKYETETIEMPIEFTNMIQITDDQFIGKTTLQWLMKAKKAGIINYDPNEQRALRRVKHGETEIWKPWVSAKNVSEIKESMLNGTYIPDPITLNIPDGSSYYYENGKLVIESLANGMFNLDDGYHRYLAMSQIHDFDKEFDYPMEIRLVNFDNAKANRFIFQQDQKTPMKKVVSDSYDPNSIANRIIQRMNMDPLFNLQGKIGRNDALISSPVLGKLITYFYPKEKDVNENMFVVETKNDLVKKFNVLSDTDTTYMTKKYTEKELIVIMYVFSKEMIKPKEYVDTINLLMSKTENEKGLIMLTPTGRVRKAGINLLEKIIGDWR